MRDFSQSLTNRPSVGDIAGRTRRFWLGIGAAMLLRQPCSAGEHGAGNRRARTEKPETPRVETPRVDATDSTTTWAVEYRVGRFQIHSDAPIGAGKSAQAGRTKKQPEQGGQINHQQVSAELLAVQRDVERTLRLQLDESTIHVVLFHAEREYNRYLSAYFPKLPRRRALYLQDRGPGMLFAYWHADLMEDLRHEVVHALVNNGGHSPPIWLDEGIAEYFEVPAGQRFTGSPHLPAIVAKCKGATPPTLAGLAKLKTMAEFTEGYYRDSWAWVHFLLHRDRPLRRQLVRYLADLRSGAPTQPLEKQLVRTCPDLHEQFVAHFTHFHG